MVILLITSGLAQHAILDTPPSVAPGSEFGVRWSGPDAPGDFIAVYEPDASAAEYLEYARTSLGNPAVLMAPEPGEYEVRYVSAAGLAELARTPLSVVVDAATGGITAPPQVNSGAEITVTVDDPDDAADYVTIVDTGAPEDAYGPFARLGGASEVALTAPEQAGEYEIRHVQARSQSVLARAPLTVRRSPKPEAAPVSTQATGQPVETTAIETATVAPRGREQPYVRLVALVAVDRGQGFRVAWTGLGSAEDRIAIVRSRGEPETALVSAPAADGVPVRIVAPDAAGEYQIVYIESASGTVLARRALEVR